MNNDTKRTEIRNAIMATLAAHDVGEMTARGPFGITFWTYSGVAKHGFASIDVSPGRSLARQNQLLIGVRDSAGRSHFFQSRADGTWSVAAVVKLLHRSRDAVRAAHAHVQRRSAAEAEYRKQKALLAEKFGIGANEGFALATPHGPVSVNEAYGNGDRVGFRIVIPRVIVRCDDAEAALLRVVEALRGIRELNDDGDNTTEGG